MKLPLSLACLYLFSFPFFFFLVKMSIVDIKWTLNAEKAGSRKCCGIVEKGRTVNTEPPLSSFGFSVLLGRFSFSPSFSSSSSSSSSSNSCCQHFAGGDRSNFQSSLCAWQDRSQILPGSLSTLSIISLRRARILGRSLSLHCE